jgi:carbamoyl-phosphate synthase small subunit
LRGVVYAIWGTSAAKASARARSSASCAIRIDYRARLALTTSHQPNFRIRLAESTLPLLPRAVLALADGTIFRGRAIGTDGMASGEVVFNTAITGYQEILTDPSYCRQIVIFTYPHIGNRLSA